jgi:hypothetical protein
VPLIVRAIKFERSNAEGKLMNVEVKKANDDACPLCGGAIKPGQPTVKVEGKLVHRMCLQEQTKTSY